MDDRQFDIWTRALAAGTSRRTGMRVLAGAGAALVAPARGSGSGARHGAAGPGDPCRRTVSAWERMRPWSAPGTGSATRRPELLHLRGQPLRLRCGLLWSGLLHRRLAAPPAPRVLAPVESRARMRRAARSPWVISTKGATPATPSASATPRRGAGIWWHRLQHRHLGLRQGGTAIADASGGDYNVSGVGNGSGGNGGGPTYAGPGDPCWSGVQCVAADTALTCDYNAYTDDYRCCAYQGDRCGWDGGCCGWLSCNDNGFCTS